MGPLLRAFWGCTCWPVPETESFRRSFPSSLLKLVYCFVSFNTRWNFCLSWLTTQSVHGKICWLGAHRRGSHRRGLTSVSFSRNRLIGQPAAHLGVFQLDVWKEFQAFPPNSIAKICFKDRVSIRPFHFKSFTQDLYNTIMKWAIWEQELLRVSRGSGEPYWPYVNWKDPFALQRRWVLNPTWFGFWSKFAIVHSLSR